MTAGNERGADISAHLARVRVCLDEALAFGERSAPSSAHDTGALAQVSALTTCIRDLVDAGGKLVRPRLVQIGQAAARAEQQHAGEGRCPACDDCTTLPPRHSEERSEDAVVALGAAFELLHVFGLLQDDVMDASPTRRGRASAHEHVAQAAAAAPGGGLSEADATRLGESIAVLAGDLAFALAGRLVRRTPARAQEAWDATVLELVHGQRLDLVLAAQGRFDAASTMAVAHAKTGAYTVQRPLELGALLVAEQPPAWLTAYGHSLGAAFALADDVIGLWGDPAVTGKPAGDDLLARKPSSVIGIADTLMDGELTRLLAPGRPDLTPAQLDAVLAHMERVGARAEAERRITEARDDALAHLAGTPCPRVHADLSDLAHRLAERRA